MRAGTTVSATSTATATTAAEASPIVVRNLMPATLKPHRATMTVVPAKTTAPPEVAVARPALGRIDAVGEVLARPRDDE